MSTNYPYTRQQAILDLNNAEQIRHEGKMAKQEAQRIKEEAQKDGSVNTEAVASLGVLIKEQSNELKEREIAIKEQKAIIDKALEKLQEKQDRIEEVEQKIFEVSNRSRAMMAQILKKNKAFQMTLNDFKGRHPQLAEELDQTLSRNEEQLESNPSHKKAIQDEVDGKIPDAEKEIKSELRAKGAKRSYPLD